MILFLICKVSYSYNFYKKIEKQQTYNEILQDLKFLCYERTDRVINRGEYSLKGSIIDVFSLVESNPIRISFDDDSIEFIKEFDPETQKTIEEISGFILSATNEIILDESTIATYKMKCKNFFDDEYVSDIEYQKITEGLMTSSIHNIMPALYENMSHILDLSLIHI